MTLKLHRPDPEGGLEPVQPDATDYRERLRSRRWKAADLDNSEVETTDPRIAVLFIAGAAVLTFLLVIAGYASGFWG